MLSRWQHHDIGNCLNLKIAMGRSLTDKVKQNAEGKIR